MGPCTLRRPHPPCLALRPASCGRARFGAPGDPSGKKPSLIKASPARTQSAKPCGEGRTWAVRGRGGAGAPLSRSDLGAPRLCVCEDPWLRRRRRLPPLGELRVPLRRLLPNRARSFSVCLEKRRLVSGGGT